MKTAIAIPVYNPEPGLGALCAGLLDRGFGVVVVDDGSTCDLDRFDGLPDGVKLLRHAQNRGKGRAIKTALEYLRRETDCGLAAFCDGDGQHRVDDVAKVCAKAAECDKIVFGVRDFFRPGIPFRSRFGNIWSSWLVRIFLGIRICDTQTGLRCLPRRLWDAAIELDGERFEYEARMFRMIKRLGESLVQVPVETVYVAGNRTSHFRPFVDSLKIHWAFFRR